MKPAVLLLVMGAFAMAAEDDLPQRGEPGRMEFEPELKLYDVKPEATGPTDPWAIPADVNKAKQAADRAQRKADRWQQLQKAGVLSKVEAERAVLQASRAAYRYQQSRAADARKQVEALAARVAKGEASPELLVTAKASLASSEALAADAADLLQRSDVEFAKNQLERQRKLAAVGLASKGQVQRAADAVEKAKTEVIPAPVSPAPKAQ